MTFSCIIDLLDQAAFPWHDTGCGNPVFKGNLMNGKEHRIALLWFGDRDLSAAGYLAGGSLFYLNCMVKNFNRGGEYPRCVTPVLHWKETRKGPVPRVTLLRLSNASFNRVVKTSLSDLLFQVTDKEGFMKLRLTRLHPGNRWSQHVVETYGDKVFADANALLDKLKRAKEVKRWVCARKTL